MTTSPAREEIELAAEFAGLGLHWDLSGKARKCMKGIFVGGHWTPWLPSEDAFRLLAKVFIWTNNNSSDDSPYELVSAWASLDRAKNSGDVDQLALATFRLAVEIQRAKNGK